MDDQAFPNQDETQNKVDEALSKLPDDLEKKVPEPPTPPQPKPLEPEPEPEKPETKLVRPKPKLGRVVKIGGGVLMLALLAGGGLIANKEVQKRQFINKFANCETVCYQTEYGSRLGFEPYCVPVCGGDTTRISGEGDEAVESEVVAVKDFRSSDYEQISSRERDCNGNGLTWFGGKCYKYVGTTPETTPGNISEPPNGEGNTRGCWYKRNQGSTGPVDSGCDDSNCGGPCGVYTYKCGYLCYDTSCGASVCGTEGEPTPTPEPASPTPSPRSPSLSCLGLTKDKITPVLGEEVNFTCEANLSTNNPIAFFRTSSDGGVTYTGNIPNAGVQVSQTSNKAEQGIRIDKAGDWVVQCRICDSTATTCTPWGAAN